MLAQADDPIADTARAAAEAAGLPAWAQALIPILAGALVAALRAWWRERGATTAIMVGVDKGVAELGARGAKVLVPVVQESIRSAAIAAGLQGFVKARLARVRAAAEARPNTGGTASPPMKSSPGSLGPAVPPTSTRGGAA